MKIKDCQGVRVRDYQHRGQYLKGDKVWYQHQDLNAWLGPAEAFYHKENKVWLYMSGNMMKVAACKHKPNKFISRDEDKIDDVDKKDEKKKKKLKKGKM